MSDRYQFWANGMAGKIRVRSYGEVRADSVKDACTKALQSMQNAFPGFVQKGTTEQVTRFPSVRKLKS